jgi:phage baseplate assembly protein W
MANSIQSPIGTPRFLKYPYSVGGSGIPNTTTADDHLRDLILQVLFTSPGERVALPEFGVGVQRLVFEPSNETLRSSAQFLISTNLQRWLGDRINVEQVNVASDPGDESAIRIEIIYTAIATQQRGSLTVQV